MDSDLWAKDDFDYNKSGSGGLKHTSLMQSRLELPSGEEKFNMMFLDINNSYSLAPDT